MEAGDVVAFARLAWQVYEIGWSEQHNASMHLTFFLLNPQKRSSHWP
jgi:hypothetical protein